MMARARPARVASVPAARITAGLLVAVVAAGALVSILFWNTATVVEMPPQGPPSCTCHRSPSRWPPPSAAR